MLHDRSAVYAPFTGGGNMADTHGSAQQLEVDQFEGASVVEPAGGEVPSPDLKRALAAAAAALALLVPYANAARIDVHRLATGARRAQTATQELATLASAASGAARRRER